MVVLTNQPIVHAPDGQNREGQEEQWRQVPVDKVQDSTGNGTDEVAKGVAGWAQGGGSGNADDVVSSVGGENGCSIVGSRHGYGVSVSDEVPVGFQYAGLPGVTCRGKRRGEGGGGGEEMKYGGERGRGVVGRHSLTPSLLPRVEGSRHPPLPVRGTWHSTLSQVLLGGSR
jgi:hypothetical protein